MADETQPRTAEEIAADIAKSEAESKQALANAEKALAEAEEARERINEAKLDQEHTRYLIEHSKIDAKIAEIALAKCEREERFAKASDLYHKVYTFDDPVSERSVKLCIGTLTAWSRDEPGCDIQIVINSPGGDIIEGFALVDFIFDLRAKGHNVTTLALGMAASMAGVLLQAGTKRVMGKNAILLVHEGSLMALGSYGEVEDHVKLMKLLHERILKLFEERSAPINPKTTAAFIRRNWARKDWWIDSDTALSLGFVDEVQ